MSLESESKEEVKKLVLVLAISTLVTGTREEAVEAAKPVGTVEAVETTKISNNGKESKGEYQNLTRVPCIHYLINFEKQSMSALINLGSKVNAVQPAFAKELGLSIRLTDVEA